MKASTSRTDSPRHPTPSPLLPLLLPIVLLLPVEKTAAQRPGATKSARPTERFLATTTTSDGRVAPLDCQRAVFTGLATDCNLNNGGSYEACCGSLGAAEEQACFCDADIVETLRVVIGNQGLAFFRAFAEQQCGAGLTEGDACPTRAEGEGGGGVSITGAAVRPVSTQQLTQQQPWQRPTAQPGAQGSDEDYAYRAGDGVELVEKPPRLAQPIAQQPPAANQQQSPSDSVPDVADSRPANVEALPSAPGSPYTMPPSEFGNNNANPPAVPQMPPLPEPALPQQPPPPAPWSPPPGGYVVGQPDPAPHLSIPPPAPQAIGAPPSPPRPDPVRRKIPGEVMMMTAPA